MIAVSMRILPMRHQPDPQFVSRENAPVRNGSGLRREIEGVINAIRG